nr:hypothetical protein [Steroidobacter cummioxidans]
MISRPNVDKQDMVLVVMNHTIEQRHELGVPFSAQAALEDRKLQPLEVG